MVNRTKKEIFALSLVWRQPVGTPPYLRRYRPACPGARAGPAAEGDRRDGRARGLQEHPAGGQPGSAVRGFAAPIRGRRAILRTVVGGRGCGGLQAIEVTRIAVAIHVVTMLAQPAEL